MFVRANAMFMFAKMTSNALHFFFYKNQIILAEPQCSYFFFPNFRLICSYFVLVTITIFDLAFLGPCIQPGHCS